MTTKIRLTNLGQDALEVVVFQKGDIALGTIQIIPQFRSMVFPVHTKLCLVINEPAPGPSNEHVPDLSQPLEAA